MIKYVKFKAKSYIYLLTRIVRIDILISFNYFIFYTLTVFVLSCVFVYSLIGCGWGRSLCVCGGALLCTSSYKLLRCGGCVGGTSRATRTQTLQHLRAELGNWGQFGAPRGGKWSFSSNVYVLQGLSDAISKTDSPTY